MLSVVTRVRESFADLVADMTISAPQLANDVVVGPAKECFHILPHREVASFMAAKTNDPERWLAAMRNLQHHLGADPGRQQTAARRHTDEPTDGDSGRC